jgi:hypothetical protein
MEDAHVPRGVTSLVTIPGLANIFLWRLERGFSAPGTNSCVKQEKCKLRNGRASQA